MSTGEAQYAARPEPRPRALDGWRRTLARKPGRAAAVAFAIALAVGAGLTLRRATDPWSVLPDNDYWGNIRGIVTENGLRISIEELFRHNNEHIVAIPKLIYAANYLIANGSNIGLILYALAAGAACAALLVYLARDLLRETPGRWVLCAVVFPLAMFSGKLSHSYYFGMSGAIWLTADIFVVLSAAALANAARTRGSLWLLASLLAALLGLLSYSTALYSLLVLLVFCIAYLSAPRLRGRFPWPVLAGVALVTAGVVAAWLAQRPHPTGHPTLEFDPIGLAAFVAIYLGASVSEGYWQPFMGLAILGAGLLAIRRLLAQGRVYDILPWVALFLFAPFNGVMTGIGRIGFGLQAATSSRYQSVAVISLIATIALVLAALPSGQTSPGAARLRLAAMAALAAMAVFFLTNSKSVALYASRLEAKPVAEIAWRLNIAGEQHIRPVSRAMNQIHAILPALRAAGHVPFDRKTACERLMGEPLPPALAEPGGAVESAALYPVARDTRQAIELSGWAARNGAGAECIAVVDGDGRVIGAGVTARKQADPVTGRKLRIGWQAVAPYPARPPICAYAWFPGAGQPVPLANCRTAIDAAPAR